MKLSKNERILGIAFLLQFITSFTSGIFIKPLWYGDNMEGTLILISQKSNMFRLNILLDSLTALGIIFLGAILFQTLKRVNKYLASTAFAFYILEGSLLASSKFGSLFLLHISKEFISNPDSSELITLAQFSYNSMDFIGNTLHMLIFCFGAMIFYYLLFKSNKVPKWLSLWGLLSLIPLMIGTISQIFAQSIPFIFYVPYVPFELFIGIWILLKGIPSSDI